MSRRPNGSGTVYRSGDVSRRRPWCAVVVIGWSPQGRPIRVSRWFATRREAEASRSRMSEALAATGALPDDRLTVAEHMDAWLAGRTDLRPNSRAAYRYAAVNIAAVLGEVRLAALRPSVIDAALSTLPPAAAKLARHVLSVALRDAERDGLVTRNPVALSRPIEADPRPARVPTVAEVRTLLAAELAARDRAMATVLLTVGLRAGELCGLRWEDVTDGRLSISRQLVRAPGGWQEGPPKTASSRRTVALVPAAVEALRRWQVESGAIAGPIFPGVTPGKLHAAVARWCTTAGIASFPPHSARRFVATILADAPKAASMVLGHGAALSLDVYARPTDERRQAAADIIAAAIG